MMVHTIAVGTVEGGVTSYGMSKLDEDSLKSLAYNTGGEFFSAENKVELKNSFSSIIDVTEKVGRISLVNYMIISVIVLFLLKQFLVGTNRVGW